MNKKELHNVCEFLKHLAEDEREQYRFYEEKWKKTINPIKRYRYKHYAEMYMRRAGTIDIVIFRLIRQWEIDKEIFEKEKEEKVS